MTTPWMPCNGAEMICFMADFCDRCQADAEYQRTGEGPGCLLIVKATAMNEQPEEWILDDDGAARCTAFVTEQSCE